MTTTTTEAKDKKKSKAKEVVISAPNFQTGEFVIEGIAPYVQNKFSQKAKDMIKATQEAGSRSKKGTKREAKDFDECYKGAMHISREGWHGIPAPAFRNALISACRVCGFTMTRAKLSVFIEADGFDAEEGTPLVKISKGEPHYHEGTVRNASGVCDLRARPMWDEGWQAKVRVRFDAEQFSLQDVCNLMHRAGQQVGVGEGRPDSKASCGMGWGMFKIVNEEGDEG